MPPYGGVMTCIVGKRDSLELRGDMVIAKVLMNGAGDRL